MYYTIRGDCTKCTPCRNNPTLHYRIYHAPGVGLHNSSTPPPPPPPPPMYCPAAVWGVIMLFPGYLYKSAMFTAKQCQHVMFM